MKVSELFEAADSVQEITVEKVGDDTFVVNTKAKSGMTLDAIASVFYKFDGKKGITLTSKSGLPLDFDRMFKNRPNGFILQFKNPEGAFAKIQAAVEAAKESTEREMAKRAKHKAEAPARRKEASKLDAQYRKADMAEYDKKYGKGTWKRVTYRQEGGDDGYQYVVRVDGRAKWNGLTQRSAAHYKEQEVDAIAKKEKLGKYATAKNVNEARTKKPARDHSPLGQLKELPQPIGINGGSYTYWVDVSTTPLVFTASDGDVVEKAKTLEDIAKWMEKWAAQLWLEFLNGEESLDMMIEERIVRVKKGRTDQQDHEAGMRG